MVRCPNCNNLNPPGNVFCGNCGYKIIAGPEEPTQAFSAKAIAAPPRFGGFKSWMLIGAALGLLLLAGLVWLISSLGGANNRPSEASLPGVTTAANPATNGPGSLPTVTPVGGSNLGQSASNLPARISPVDLKGTYSRDDSTLYGRPEVALYGAGSGYEQGTVTFKLNGTPRKLNLRLTGLDDERAEHCQFQVLVNDRVVFEGASSFPNTPGNDTGVGGSDRFWGQMSVAIPPEVLKVGNNTVILRNLTPWSGSLGIPYILINTLEFAES